MCADRLYSHRVHDDAVGVVCQVTWDIHRELTDPEYSAIKTTVTDLLDWADQSPRPWVRDIGRELRRLVPNDWGNWFSEAGPHKEI